MNILQTVVLPNLEVPASEDMYLRLSPLAWCELGRPAVHFEDGGLAWTDTFYGSFSLGVWQAHCDFQSLFVGLEGEGHFVVTVGVHRLGQGDVWLGEHAVALERGARADLPITGWRSHREGLLFFRLRAIGPGVIRSARYLTADPVARDVRLGIVVTHFNRQAQVLPAIERVRRHVLERADLEGRISLTVVDNSRNLPLEPTNSLKLIPNRNLGGTGGYMRGLLDLIDQGTYSHALFMDDDASCEPESIARAHALLGHARNPRLAVAGALLSEAEPWHLLEKGARFSGHCEPLHTGADMRRVDALLWCEREIKRPDYGGWWFFAFPVAGIERFPFPFFVRGDDVFFSVSNRFELATMNGIACFGEDFGQKHGPMTAYLDARYHLLHALLDERRGAQALLRIARRQFLRPLLAYHYSSARAVTLALRHLAQGPAFFRENLDLADVRAEIASWTPAEKMLPLDRTAFDTRGPRRRPEGRLRVLLRALTLQGFLLPKPLLKNRVLLQRKAFHGSPASVFRYRRVLYEHFPSNTGYVAEHDRRRFFGELGRFIGAFAAFLRRLPELRRAHRRGFDEMTTLDFWRAVYAGVPKSKAMPAATGPGAEGGALQEPAATPRPTVSA